MITFFSQVKKFEKILKIVFNKVEKDIKIPEKSKRVGVKNGQFGMECPMYNFKNYLYQNF